MEIDWPDPLFQTTAQEWHKFVPDLLENIKIPYPLLEANSSQIFIHSENIKRENCAQIKIFGNFQKTYAFLKYFCLT